MAKRKNSKAANLFLMLIGLVLVAVSLIGLVCNFISQKTTILGKSNTINWSLSDWFDSVKNMKDLEAITNWQIAQIMLMIISVLLVVMVVLMVVKFFVKHQFLKWSTLGAAVIVFVCALVFVILTFTGCQDLNTTVLMGGARVEYTVSAGVYLFGIGAMVSSVLAMVIALRK
ncbi:MAG: hypothetical protein MJ054_02340 [Clostridia bacterium]|nr:hypothetical protein [Clostridia bacterium]